MYKIEIIARHQRIYNLKGKKNIVQNKRKDEKNYTWEEKWPAIIFKVRKHTTEGIKTNYGIKISWRKSLFWEDIWEVFLNIEKRKIN